MRTIRISGLAMITTMLLIEASPTMAETTALCSEDPASLACPSGKLISHVHETTLTGAEATLLTDFGDIECDVLFLGDVENAGLQGNPLYVEGKFTYSSCNLGCSVTQINGEVSIEVLRIGHEETSVLGEGEVLVRCPLLFNMHCIYNGEGLQGTGLGPLLANAEMPNGEVRLEKQAVEKVSGGGICPTVSELDLLIGPSATYIAS